MIAAERLSRKFARKKLFLSFVQEIRTNGYGSGAVS